MAKINRTAAVWREPAQVARLEEYHRLHPERKGKAPLVGFVQASGDRPGIGIDSEGKEIEFAEKPPDSDFITPKPGTPEGQFIEDPVTGEKIPLNTAQERRQSIYQSAGGIRDRKNERIMAAKLFARQESKKQIDGKTTEFGYTPKQQRNLDAIQNSRAKLEQEFSEKMWTPDQMHRMEVELSQREGLILPQRVRRQPTIHEQFKQRTFKDPISGVPMYLDKNNEPKMMPNMPDHKLLFDLRKDIAENMQLEILDSEGKGTGEFRDLSPQEVNNRVAQTVAGNTEIYNILGGGGGSQAQQQPGILAERKAGFAKENAQQQETEMRAQGKADNVPQEVIDAEMDKRFRPQAQERPATSTTGHKLFKDLPEAKQKKLLEDNRKEQAKKGRSTAPKTFTTPIGQITRPRRTPFKLETEASFIKEYDNNEAFRRGTGIFERVEGVLPAIWEDLTAAERGKMVAIWNTKFLGFREKELSESDMRAKVEDDPDLIESLLGKKGKKR